MLSKINRMIDNFEQKNGFRPNLLYLNTSQLELLQEQLSEYDIAILSQLIGMEIVIVENKGESTLRPYVSWAQIHWKHSKTA